MSYIVRTGDLAETPKLRNGERGVYAYARVIVNDSVRLEDGSYVDGPAVPYEVAVNGSQAENLVDVAERCGNVRVTFSDSYRVTEFQNDRGTRIHYEVRADDIAVSLRGQKVTVERADTGDGPRTDPAF